MASSKIRGKKKVKKRELVGAIFLLICICQINFLINHDSWRNEARSRLVKEGQENEERPI